MGSRVVRSPALALRLASVDSHVIAGINSRYYLANNFIRKTNKIINDNRFNKVKARIGEISDYVIQP